MVNGGTTPGFALVLYRIAIVVEGDVMALIEVVASANQAGQER